MLIFLILAVVYGVVLHFTPFGRSLYAIGANQEAAIFAGIRVKRIKTLLFIVSGVICSGAGILYTFRLSTAVQDNGLGLELSVVAVVLLGGISIFGGVGSIIGVVLAVFVFAGLQNALFLTNFPERALGIVTGGLLLVSVLVPNASSFVQRGRELLKRREVRGRAAASARQPSVEAEDLLEGRRPCVRHARVEQRSHVVLPARAHLLLGEIELGSREVVSLEVAEHLVPGPENRVVADPGPTQSVEHLGPDARVRCHVVVDPLGPNVQNEGGSLVMGSLRARGELRSQIRVRDVSETSSSFAGRQSFG